MQCKLDSCTQHSQASMGCVIGCYLYPAWLERSIFKFAEILPP